VTRWARRRNRSSRTRQSTAADRDVIFDDRPRCGARRRWLEHLGVAACRSRYHRCLPCTYKRLSRTQRDTGHGAGYACLTAPNAFPRQRRSSTSRVARPLLLRLSFWLFWKAITPYASRTALAHLDIFSKHAGRRNAPVISAVCRYIRRFKRRGLPLMWRTALQRRLAPGWRYRAGRSVVDKFMQHGTNSPGYSITRCVRMKKKASPFAKIRHFSPSTSTCALHSPRRSMPYLNRCLPATCDSHIANAPIYVSAA